MRVVGLFAAYFTIRPWEIDLLTHDQFLALEREAYAIQKAQQTAQQ